MRNTFYLKKQQQQQFKFDNAQCWRSQRINHQHKLYYRTLLVYIQHFTYTPMHAYEHKLNMLKGLTTLGLESLPVY
jgi:Txe/YoeB family toxin of Txe-Axe toxin-antitoxin module